MVKIFFVAPACPLKISFLIESSTLYTLHINFSLFSISAQRVSLKLELGMFAENAAVSPFTPMLNVDGP